MKKFSFSLEKVLKLRKYREQETKLELGRAVSALAEIERNIQLVAQERVRAAASQFDSSNSAREIFQHSLYISRLDNTKEKLLADAAAAELKVEEARNIFIEASRERKVLDKLKEKKQAEHKREFYREETKTLDDVASGALARRLAV